MYLARIEMTGFKSFADKTVIEFDRGMTAVVGPNGSGKSNLSEAIRWVLGEQSAKSLRGNKMEDVIFNGTQARKAVNLAKVTLVLNNEDRYLDYDFSEISITRSYNRNGESQYFINNEAVRLKDIVDLLLDSGLGKNSFAMISQGKVESIFLNKPEERRSIFEEAAGVQKYQFRKQEAERKLSKSSDHLSRVRDIIHELELQLKPLKQQQEAALLYLEQKEALKQLEISLYVYQVEQYRDAWQAAKAKNQAVSQELAQVTAQLEALTAQLEQEQASLEDYIQQIEQASERNQAQVQVIEQTRAKQQMLDQQIQFNTSNLHEKQLSYQQHQAEAQTLTERLSALKEEEGKVQLEMAEIKQHLAKLESERSSLAGLSEDQAERLRADLIDAYQAEASAKNQLAHQEQIKQQAQARLAHYQAQAAQAQADQGDLESQYLEAQERYESSRETQASARQAFQTLNEQLRQGNSQREALQAKLFQFERQSQMLDAKVQSLSQLQADYAGYYAGVKAIMKRKKQLQGIEGTVADLIKVPADYQVAIDTALGASVQHVVVTDDAAARAAIAYLKQAQAGRATFLPRASMKARHLGAGQIQTASQTAGFIGLASDLVEYDPVNQIIVANLLGTTLVCDRIEAAQSLAKALKHQVKIVTLDGEVLMPGGSITGGRQKQQTSSMLARNQEYEAAKADLAQVIKDRAQAEAEWQAFQVQIQDLQGQVEAARLSMSQADLAFQQAQEGLGHLASQVKHQSQHQLIAQDEVSQLSQTISNAEAHYEQAQEDLVAAQAAIARLSQDLQQLNLSEEDRQQQLQVLDASLSHYRTQEAVKQVEVRQLRHDLATAKSQLEERQNFLMQYENLADQNSADLAELERQSADLLEQLADLEATAQEQQAELTALREARRVLNETYRAHEQEDRQLQGQLQQLYKDEARAQAQIEKNESLIDSHLDYLSQEYQLTYEAAKTEASQLDDASQVSQQVKQIKRQIDNLGPINLAAIDDYAALDERYTHLREQETDLLTAMGQLQETMDEMDAEVIKRFSEAFHQINQQFQKIFKKLFAGGEAALQLTDPSDLLTTGIDIIAQPPGKRKQHLALLSGGERAFTAIALLFAILETRPVPFCVLDEVEAALDDANVFRYGQYLQNFTENTQFIVITHRKGTMEHADVLYGVTMEQSGVSKLASVRLSEANYD